MAHDCLSARAPCSLWVEFGRVLLCALEFLDELGRRQEQRLQDAQRLAVSLQMQRGGSRKAVPKVAKDELELPLAQ